ncbi:MAG: SUMF1/EgtB/PvdO family nonheme iron enzyme [Bacteroidia bacterium]
MRKTLRNLLTISLLWMCTALCADANNVQVSQVSVIGSKQIQFIISWENSWKLDSTQAPNNHDAVWIFVKYREVNSTGSWKHVNISEIATDHTASAYLEIETVKDQKGIFLKRKHQGTGHIQNREITLEWASYLPQGSYDFKVFAIEMVWVNEGSFYVGDAASQSRFRNGDSDQPFHITGNQKIPVGKASSMLNDTGKFAPTQDIPATYPKGYNGFYCMKYEMSQQQYVDFLNCLSYKQQQKRTATSPASIKGTSALNSFLANRNGIVIETPGEAFSRPALYGSNAKNDNVFNASDDAQTRACNFLNWADLAAYLDWVALRPLTEFEFEKVCRGPINPVKLEFAWGTDKVVDANTLQNDGAEDESVTEKGNAVTGLASHGYYGPQGGLRTGFAATDATGRVESGATYYGAMEMSGNLWEMCVTVNDKGLEFDGESGDGELDENGNPNSKNWPALDGTGAGFRGGGWNSGVLPEFRDLAVSDRFYAGQAPTQRRGTSGGRGAR